MTRRTPLIAIDGPAGSGKSSLARGLAGALGLAYVNTGLMYRAVTLAALEERVSPDDAIALTGLAERLAFDLDESVRPPELRIDGRPPSAALTSREVESTVSLVARHAEVRAVLRDRQRALAQHGGVVEGRDIGTVVAPNADVKIYLEANEQARIERRRLERGSVAGEVGHALPARDALDARTTPLEAADDAVVIDTTDLSREQVHDAALHVVRANLLARGWRPPDGRHRWRRP